MDSNKPNPADRSRANKSGQLHVLRTVVPSAGQIDQPRIRYGFHENRGWNAQASITRRTYAGARLVKPFIRPLI